ncbi:hypothetical protein AB1Y20_021420 [Prymnesium parvum]|uniref:Fe2OG dioxygenase domain-containing protein n=1 Tax=Prymnesium parvum TaxID=97485 RepID=A0AB34JIL9_PRYPA
MAMAALLLSLPFAQQRVSPQRIIKAYESKRRHPQLFDSRAGWTKWMSPSLVDALDVYRSSGGHNTTAILALLREEVEGVYSFDLFNEDFCDLFLEELDNYYASGLPIYRPNSMNNYGIIVNQIGMEPVITTLQKAVLHPIASILYPVQAGSGFTGHHSFMVKYRADEDMGLDMHTDDSDVTFNICLGRNFTGASLTICGDSRTPRHRQFFASYEHVRGRALVHLGSRRHGADDIRSGQRNNLIVWNSNEAYRESAAYVNKQPYLKEAGAPDPRCLSYTHDRDFGEFLDYPPGKSEYAGKGWCPPAFACYDEMAPVFRGRRAHDEL